MSFKINYSQTKRLLLFLILLSFEFGFAGAPLWTSVPSNSSEPIKDLEPNAICTLLTMPGDFVANTAYYAGKPNSTLGQIVYHTVDPYGLFGMILDALAFNNPYQEYSHTAFVQTIDSKEGFLQTSWFAGRELGVATPTTRPEYYENYGIFRVKGGLAVNERALQRSYSLGVSDRYGVCSTAVNALYDDRLSTWYDETGEIKKHARGIGGFILNRTTPTRVANAPLAQAVCLVKNNQIVYPHAIHTAQLVRFINEGLSSKEQKIIQHAQSVLVYLYKNGFIENNQIKKQYLKFVD